MSIKINKKISKYNHYDMDNRKIKYIVIHWVGAASSAKNNADYFYSADRRASAHYFVDDKEIWQSVLDKNAAWAVGGGPLDQASPYAKYGKKYFNKCTNSNSISIEMCCKKNSQGKLYITDETIELTAELVQMLQKKYSILDKKGKEIYKDPVSKEVYSDNAADDITNILKGVITNGTASSMYWYSKTKTEAAGKTGTTNNSKDGWFCGYTPYYTMAVWIGYDTPKSLNSLKGSSYPATIWKESMLNLIADKETKSFEKSEFYEEKPIVYHGNATIILPESAYDKYMQGRDDSEEIVEGYTVYDYRVDRTIGESVFAVINQINALDKTSPTFEQDIATLYSNGTSTIATIYSRSYAEEITLQLNNAYITKIQ